MNVKLEWMQNAGSSVAMFWSVVAMSEMTGPDLLRMSNYSFEPQPIS